MTSRQSAPDARIRSFVERICRLKAEQDALQLDIQAVYLEAKKDNLDKTALGQVVSIVRKREKNREKFEESANVVEMYLAAVDGHGSHAYAHMPQKPAPRQEEIVDAETGEITEAAKAPLASIATVRIGDGPEISLEDFRKAAQSINTPAGMAVADGARDPVTGITSPVQALGAIIKARHPDAPPPAPAPYRIDAPTAPKPPVEDLDLPAGLRREPVRSAAE